MFFAPLALLLVGAVAAVASEGGIASGTKASLLSAQPAKLANQPALTNWPLAGGTPPESWKSPAWRQVRIEQRFSIRITPGTATMPQAMVEELEEEERVERVGQHHIGKCLGINAIAAVRPGDGDQLLLFLHDQRIVTVKLQKRCNARDFYSGFYLAENADGAICAGRDILQSRSGANCKVRSLNELVPSGFRRFP